MQILLIFVVLFIGTNASSEESGKDIFDELEEIARKCAEAEGATEDDLDELEELKFPPSSHPAKCVIACVYEHYNILKANGTYLDKHAAIHLIDGFQTEDPDLYRKVATIINICHERPLISHDRCETASSMAACLRRGAIALDLIETSDSSEEIFSDMYDAMTEVAEACVDKVGATDADLKELEENKFPPSTYAAKCVLACIYGHYKILNADGTLDADVVIETLDDLKTEDEESYEKMLKIVNICHRKQRTYSDPCETASAMTVCLHRGAESLGLIEKSFKN